MKTAERLAKKIAAYQEEETRKVTGNLIKIAKGDLDVNTVSAEADNDTKGAKEKFDIIYSALNQSVHAIELLVDDAVLLAQAGVEGKLDVRADAGKHQGDFRKIIDGVNKTLNAVIGPLNTAADYIEMIAKGDIPSIITEKLQW